MWSVNETLAFDGKTYRVLFAETNYFYWIAIDEDKGLPERVYFDECRNWVDEGRIEKIPDPYSYLQGESWTKESNAYQKRQNDFDLIKPIVDGEGAFDKRVRAKRVSHAVANSNKTKSTIYRLIRRYWQRGQIKNALIPDYKNSGAAGKRRNFTTNKAGKSRVYGVGDGKQVTEEIRKQFRIICDKYLMNDKGNSVAYAHRKFSKAYKLKNPDVEEHEIPTLRQFRYFYKTEYSKVTKLTVQTPQGNYNKDVRPLYGTATEQALGPGSRYEIDATIADIYLVDDDDADKVIGRPTIYMVIDVFSRMVAGFYIGFDNPSFPVAIKALICSFSSKVETCAKYGIDISEEQWPCIGIPDVLLADRGELMSHQANYLVDAIGVRLESAPPRRGDAKGIVERSFGTLQAKFKPYMPGVVTGNKVKKHGEKDYRVEAAVARSDFVEILLYSILAHNLNKPFEKYDRAPDMPESLPSISIELWRWGLQNRTGRLRAIDTDIAKILLLPRQKVDYGWQEGIAPGSVSVKQSLGNVLRMVRPVIIVDEGHKAYSETARETLCGFNPKFILELSATPNANGKHHSNVLVNVSGQALKDEQMIKLPINLINEDKSEWKHTLSLAHAKLAELEQDAGQLQSETGRYIRPIMLIRVERTGKDQRDSAFVHAEDAREYLMEKLGVHENEIRLKTSDKDELGDDDLLSEMCPVKYIITKDALREGWDCPFAYVLTVLSKMTAKTAITQMIGRVLRQPHARLTQKPSLDECYVYTFDQDVMEAVAGVKQGLEEEGMGDVANQVKASEANKTAAVVSKETLLRRERFRNLPKIFLPRVLHRDAGYKDGYRLFDYERDVLGDLDWESLSYLNAENFQLVDDKLQRTIARIDYKMSKDNQGELDLADPIHENIDFDPSAGLDISFMVRQLTDVIPNPWQAMRVLTHTLDILRGNGVSEEALFTNRLELLKEMKRDIKQQVAQLSEQIFRSKLDNGDISLRLLASDNKKLNWELAQTLEVNVSEHDQVLRRKDGSELENSLFEKVYQNGLNNLERDTAWYLDKQESVYWWHRIAVNQREYSLQGWQKQKVYPDLLVCVEQPNSGSYRFSVLETKGEHLKGNDDTEYKRRLFELLTEHVKTAVDAGELTLEAASGGMSFRMLMEDSWSQEIVPELN